MFPCNCRPPFPRPEPFSPLPRPGRVPDWGKWIRDRLSEKGALLAFPSASTFPDPGAQPNVYEALDTGTLYRWDGVHYQVLVDPSAANDVLEYEDRGHFPETGRAGAVYIDASANLLYRWDGTGYVLLTSDLSGVESRLADVESKVPAQATAQNQLADKAFVNSSIATSTAFYISDGGRPFRSLADLESYEGALTNNDYAFVVGRDAAGNTTYTRYKWNEATEAWGEEYVLNNSSFTAEQWAAISSGITSGLVAKLGALPTAEALAAALAGKRNYTDLSYDTIETVEVPALHSVMTVGGQTLAEHDLLCTEEVPDPPEVGHVYTWRADGAAFYVTQGRSALQTAWILYSQNDEVLDSVTTQNATQGFYPDIELSPGNPVITIHKTTAQKTVTVEDMIALESKVYTKSQTDALLAGKATKADATLTERGFSAWTILRDGVDVTSQVLYTPSWEPSPYGFPEGAWYIHNSIISGDQDITGGYIPVSGGESALELTWPVRDANENRVEYTATRTALQGYRLGPDAQTNPNRDKPLASEAEAEALRTEVAGKQNALTFDSAPTTGSNNPVKSGGIWSALWGALAALPTGFSSLYDWCVAQLAGKLDKSGGEMTGELFVKVRNSYTVHLGRLALSDARNGVWWSDPLGATIDACGIYCGSLSGDLIIVSQGNKVLMPPRAGTLALVAANPAAGNLAALDTDGNPTNSQIPAAGVALKGNIPYSLSAPIVIDTASSETVEGETVYYGEATLANRTANIVQVTAATALDELRIAFPAATSDNVGKVRDFGLRVEIGTGSAALAAPALVPIAPTGETIKIENAGGAIPALADGTATAKGVTLLYFSENAPGVFVVKGEQVEKVA